VIGDHSCKRAKGRAAPERRAAVKRCRIAGADRLVFYGVDDQVAIEAALRVQ
jgi:hypothetical protein